MPWAIYYLFPQLSMGVPLMERIELNNPSLPLSFPRVSPPHVAST